MKYITLIITTAFIFISLFFGLNKKDKTLNSPLLNKPIPEINLDSLKNEKLNESDFKKEILLVNFFASWCVPCIVEHDFLFELKKQKPIKIYGINYKDDIKNLEIWLEKLGNPYSKIGIDKTGITGINWGVNGIPESFLIDKNGIIKHKINGVINEKEIKILLTKIEALEK
jgi:cytochrome c biogenesis protein CcmG/thiol:disulfide interchange protein DsbE|tara:strand:+ start:177 stop:689 length:513 start_codon:yes stop_codon:yes gene_type:complete